MESKNIRVMVADDTLIAREGLKLILETADDIEVVGDQLGKSASKAGDVNGDGFDDVIIGAPVNFGMRGEAYIFHGSASGIADCNMSGACTANTTLTGAVVSDEFGLPTSFIGDINGDGLDDIAVGANGYDNVAVTEVGAVFVYYGPVAGGPDITILGANSGDRLADFPRVALNLDGLGSDDLAVGATKFSSFFNRACLLI